jgi:sulfur-carrier protein adenylyltransferase/sulfurtransferase
MNLSKNEIQRYNRQLILPEIGTEGQLKLKMAKVLVIGAGGLGCPVLQYLAAAGVGQIGMVDSDKVDVSNLHRQILFSLEDIGESKAMAAKKRLLASNPEVKIDSFCDYLSKENVLSIFQNYDLIVDGSDNFATRYLVNDACVLLNKPLVFGAIFKFEGQISVFNYQNGPSYRCLFPEQPSADSIPTCSQIGVLGTLTGVVGSLMANETIKVILDRKDTLSGRFLTFDLLSMNFFDFTITKNAKNFALKELGDYQVVCEPLGVKEISVDELASSMESYFLVDARLVYERELANINNSLSVPFTEIDSYISLIPRDRKVAVFCHFGNMSKEFCKQLIQQYGFKEVYSLAGGINEWSQEIDHSVPIY